jgi:hypothetical protein
MRQPVANISPGQQDFSKDNVRELFNLLERTVELKINGIIIYVYNRNDSALPTFKKNLEK